MFLSGLVSLCSWIHSALLSTQAFEFAIPMIYIIFVLRDTDQTIPLHEYAAHCCQPELFFCCISSVHAFLPRSTVSWLLSFTLNWASATTSHSIMSSRRNGKFTYLGFVRSCLIGLALLIRFLVLWFMEWIIIKLSTELLRSFPSVSWQVPCLVPAYHSHSWYGASQSGAQSNTIYLILRYVAVHIYIQRPWLRSHKLQDCTKSTNNLANTITMVAEPLTPPAVWIWWTHTTGGGGGLALTFFEAAVELAIFNKLK